VQFLIFTLAWLLPNHWFEQKMNSRLSREALISCAAVWVRNSSPIVCVLALPAFENQEIERCQMRPVGKRESASGREADWFICDQCPCEEPHLSHVTVRTFWSWGDSEKHIIAMRITMSKRNWHHSVRYVLDGVPNNAQLHVFRPEETPNPRWYFLRRLSLTAWDVDWFTKAWHHELLTLILVVSLNESILGRDQVKYVCREIDDRMTEVMPNVVFLGFRFALHRASETLALS
jgi:hypothetical protein